LVLHDIVDRIWVPPLSWGSKVLKVPLLLGS
jgi:hypothetical protein